MPLNRHRLHFFVYNTLQPAKVPANSPKMQKALPKKCTTGREIRYFIDLFAARTAHKSLSIRQFTLLPNDFSRRPLLRQRSALAIRYPL